MAINIFQGGKSSNKGKSQRSARSVRETMAKAALTVPSVVSDSGSTAVGKTGTLQKVGKVVGEVAGIASKFLPGIGGTIAKGLNNILNDPEWWRQVPGDAVTLNSPLRAIEVGTEKDGGNNDVKVLKPRFAMAEFVSGNALSYDTVIHPTSTQVANYLMPEIRKVVNAVPLQSATDYSTILEVNATIYALWRTLRKFDYILKHGQTYLASLNDDGFPIFQVQNAAWLQATIGRLEEYLRSHVRLPHTLCEYLAWRFGRVYKSNQSAKSGLIMYNVYSFKTTISDLESAIASLMAIPTSTVQLQQANTDLYNAYFDHDIFVEIADHTQFTYDWKEFCLRTNCDIRPATPSTDTETPDAVYIDSSMDNPTTFMASTVSTVAFDGTNTSWLFPIEALYCYMPVMLSTFLWEVNAPGHHGIFYRVSPHSLWVEVPIYTFTPGDPLDTSGLETERSLSRKLGHAIACKALDIYNKDQYLSLVRPNGDPGTPAVVAVDITVLSMDMGTVQATTLANEHTYAFANLVSITRKKSMSYKEAETLVARDTANFVEKLDIATAK